MPATKATLISSAKIYRKSQLMQDNVLAVIPARGGSKRLPNKNVKDVGGKPLIARAIYQAEKSEIIDHHIISTDDREIKSVAEKYGGNVPFTRPDRLATDEARLPPVITHAVEWFEEHHESIDIICRLVPTTPLRSPKDIDEAIELLTSKEAKSLISISEYMDPPQWSVVLDEDGYVREYMDDGALWADTIPSHQLADLKRPDGSIMISDRESWREENSFFTDSTIGYEVSPLRSIDIDKKWELELANAIHKHYNW